MPPRPHSVPRCAFRLPRLLAALSLAGGCAFAADATPPAAPATVEYRRASLAERPPFAKAERGAVKPSSGGPLDLRGFFGSGDSLEVSLSRPDGKESAWCKVGDKSAKWVVDAADPDAGTATVHFDGMLLQLKLARPEPPSFTVTPAADTEKPAKADRPASRRLSEAGRTAMRAAMREGFERARKEHPEYFDGTKLTPEQSKERDDYIRAGMARVRESVAKVSPEDAAQIENMPMPGMRPRRSASNTPPSDTPESDDTITH